MLTPDPVIEFVEIEVKCSGIGDHSRFIIPRTSLSERQLDRCAKRSPTQRDPMVFRKRF